MKNLEMRNFEVSLEDAQQFLWHEASKHTVPFWKPVIIDRAAMIIVGNLCSWTEEERLIACEYFERCFSVMVREGNFERVKSGKSIGNYNCICAPKPQTSPQLELPFGNSEVVIPAPRVSIVVSRIVRDTRAAISLKKLYDDCCQLCGITLSINESNYCEAHHLRPLGTPHDGPDSWNNMMILCPNHHVLFDYGVPIWRGEDKIELNGVLNILQMRHTLEAAYIDYYCQHLQIGKK